MTRCICVQKSLVFWMCAAVIGICLSGCGDDADTLSERVSGPASNAALPIRVDATPTPTGTASPSIAVTPAATQTPQLNAKTDPAATPTPAANDIHADIKTTPLPQGTPTPTLNQEEEIANAEGSEEEEAAESEEVEDADDADQEESKLPVVTAKGAKLEKIAVCSAIKSRNASGVASEFSYKKVKKIYTWTKFSGIKAPITIKHHYYLNGKAVETVKLTLKYSAMRSWSHKTLTSRESIGKWKVVITTDNDKEILSEQEFTVVK